MRKNKTTPGFYSATCQSVYHNVSALLFQIDKPRGLRRPQHRTESIGSLEHSSAPFTVVDIVEVLVQVQDGVVNAFKMPALNYVAYVIIYSFFLPRGSTRTLKSKKKKRTTSSNAIRLEES